MKWRAPATGATPAKANLKLIVVEKYQTTNDSGLPITVENRVDEDVTRQRARLGEGSRRHGDASSWTNFSKSEVSVSTVDEGLHAVAAPAPRLNCSDVEDNRDEYTITSYSVGPPTVTVDFDGQLRVPQPVRRRLLQLARASGHLDRRNPTATPASPKGIDQVAAVYRIGPLVAVRAANSKATNTLGSRPASCSCITHYASGRQLFDRRHEHVGDDEAAGQRERRQRRDDRRPPGRRRRSDSAASSGCDSRCCRAPATARQAPAAPTPDQA